MTFTPFLVLIVRWGITHSYRGRGLAAPRGMIPLAVMLLLSWIPTEKSKAIG